MDTLEDRVEQAFREGYTEAMESFISPDMAETLKDFAEKCDSAYNQQKSLEKIATHYGVTNQLNMMIEEMAELTQAICKNRREYPDAYENLKEELADVMIVANQLYFLLGSEEIDAIMQNKIDRQLKRIEEERNIGY